MVLVCAACGKEMIVETKLTEGQHIKCPHCGEKTAYAKPTRIELPLPQEQKIEKPTLRVIRKDPQNDPKATQDSQNPNFEKRLYMAEEHQRFYEEMKGREHRRQQLGKITSLISVTVLVALAGGIYLFLSAQREKREQAELALATERIRLEAEQAKAEREAKAQREAEQKIAKEKREAEEQARREKLAAEESMRKAEREKEENELLGTKMILKKAIAALANGKFNVVKTLPKNRELGKCDAEFYFLLPFLENGDIVVCQSKSNGEMSATRISPSGNKSKMDNEILLSTLKDNDYLAAIDGQTYFRTKRAKPNVGQIEKTKVIDLQKEFFGDIYSEVKHYEIYPDGLNFEIVFIPRGSKKIIITQTVENGMAYSLEKVKDSIAEAFPMKERAFKTSKAKPKFKRTVIIWDGPSKRTVDGIEYVSRTPPPLRSDKNYWWRDNYGWYRTNEGNRHENSVNARERWQSRYDEGLRQEKAEQEFYAKQNEDSRATQERENSKNEQAYAARINRILEEGTLHYRAKIQSVSR